MVRMILYFKAAVIGGHRTTLIKENWVSLISENAVYICVCVCVRHTCLAEYLVDWNLINI